ncbi:MAG: hypothetical protein QM689_12780 [Oscillospiraceae bacterium]
MRIADKLMYLADTKIAIAAAIVEKGGTITPDTTFREYAELIRELSKINIYYQPEQPTGEIPDLALWIRSSLVAKSIVTLNAQTINDTYDDAVVILTQGGVDKYCVISDKLMTIYNWIYAIYFVNGEDLTSVPYSIYVDGAWTNTVWDGKINVMQKHHTRIIDAEDDVIIMPTLSGTVTADVQTPVSAGALSGSVQAFNFAALLEDDIMTVKTLTESTVNTIFS